MIDVVCPYCAQAARLVSRSEVYPHLPDNGWRYFRCEPCDAHIACDPRSGQPQGRLANAALRSAKRMAHGLFDAVWKGSHASMTRSQARHWLADRLGMAVADCQIANFDLAQCWQTIAVLRQNRNWQRNGTQAAVAWSVGHSPGDASNGRARLRLPVASRHSDPGKPMHRASSVA
ncbi:zinc-finger-containing protein [Chitinimonas sp.]|uniref:zinc-finger-containing protein n=1 Tax=Chitinimonas sp. TaxID=1934313 RepID=UPI0035B19404